MKALILVAGQSVRMGKMTDDSHKSLLDVRGRPILGWILSALERNGIDTVYFTSGFNQELLKDYVRNNHPNLTTEWVENEEYADTNTAYSVWLARELLLGGDDDILLLNGDVLLDHRVITATLEAEGANVLATRFNEVDEEEVKLTLREDVVTEIGKHIDPQSAAGESVGINKLSRPLLDDLIPALERRIKEGAGRSEFYEQTFNELVQNGVVFRTADVTFLPVIEIDTPEDYEIAKKEHATALEE